MEFILKPIGIKGTIQIERNIRKIRKLKQKLIFKCVILK